MADRTPTEAEPGEAEVEVIGQLIEDRLFPIFGAGPYEALAREIAALRSTTPASERPLDMCSHGADRGSYCGYCGGYSEGAEA